MAPKVDPAILTGLGLEAEATTMSSHGGSGFASTYKITSKGANGEEKLFFVKTGGDGGMFAGEFVGCF